MNFLMTDKIQSSMYLENHILKRKDRIFKEENIKTSEGYTERYIKRRKPKTRRCNAIHLRPKAKAEVNLVKLIRAQGGCLGTKSR